MKALFFFQFHVEDKEQFEEIANFVEGRPLHSNLSLCVGLSLNSQNLKDSATISHINSTIDTINSQNIFTPVLHYSFNGTIDALEDIKKIKQTFLPCCLQANDLPPGNSRLIKTIARDFRADIPFSDDTFSLLQEESLREVLLDNSSFILLDNSKGHGIQEDIKSLRKKLDFLLTHNLERIALLGGFGPDELDSYFSLSREYKRYFSIDAETKLKTQGKFDMEKTKKYLNQLIEFSETQKFSLDI